MRASVAIALTYIFSCTQVAHAACNQGAPTHRAPVTTSSWCRCPIPTLRVSAICFATVVAAALPMPARRSRALPTQ